MPRADYPLKQVLEIKLRRVEEAEKVVKEKQQILEQEEEKLVQRKAERDKARQHHQDKLEQLREEMDHGTTSPKIQQMKAYLKVAQERLKVEEKKVQEQQSKVELAKKEVEEAKKLLNLRRLEVDKVNTHREGWEKEKNKEDEIIAERAMDDLGTMIYTSKQRRDKELNE